MADSTIANLTSGSPAQASDVLPIQRGGSTLKLSVSDILGVAVVNLARVTVSSAHLLNNATPTIVVPAPGVGKYIVPIFAIFNYKFGTTPYVVNTGVAHQFYLSALPLAGGGNGLWVDSDMDGFFDQATDQVTTCFSAIAGLPSPPVCSQNVGTAANGPFKESDIDNGPIYFNIDNNMTGGDGSLDVIVWYTVIAKA